MDLIVLESANKTVQRTGATLDLKPLGDLLQLIIAFLSRPREKRRINCYGLMARHDD
jgi:hypothetical protein